MMKAQLVMSVILSRYKSLGSTVPVQRPGQLDLGFREEPLRHLGGPWPVLGYSLAKRDNPGYSPDVLICLDQSG